MNDRQPLTMLPRRLSAYGPAPTYRRIWKEVVNGKLLMIKKQGGQWVFEEADVPAIAAALGLAGPEGKTSRAA